MLIIWGLRVIYRTLGQGVFFCRRCGGDREYRHRAGRRFVTVFFIPLIPLAKTGEHVQCLACKTRYVTEVLKLPTTVRHAARGVGRDARAGRRDAPGRRPGEPAGPPARDRRGGRHRGAGLRRGRPRRRPREPAAAEVPKIAALGGQLQVEAKEWYLAEAIRIALADGPLTGPERVAAVHLATALGMTQAQAVGVITLTGQNAGQS